MSEGACKQGGDQGLHGSGQEERLARAARGQVAFLRHRLHDLPRTAGSDWDIAVRDSPAVRTRLVDLYGLPDIEVRRTYVEQFFFSWGQVDLLPCFQWDGLEFLGNERFWEGVKEGEDGLPRPRLAHDALIAWMTGLLANGSCHPKYQSLILRATIEDGAELRECLREGFGEFGATTLWDLARNDQFLESADCYRKVRWALIRQRLLGSTWISVLSVARHWRCEFAHHYDPPFPWVAVLGPDGSGKSSVINEIRERFLARRLKVHLMHWCPRWGGHEADSSITVSDPHGGKKRGHFWSLVALLYLCSRWVLARVGRAWHRRAKNCVLISDRFYWDLVVDPQRYRYGGSIRIAKWFFKRLPSPDLVIILHGEAEVIYRRKQEVPLEELRRQLDCYAALEETFISQEIGVSVVKCDRALESVIGEVEEAIREKAYGK